MQTQYQLTLPAKTFDNATPEEREVLAKAKAQVGFIPNMYSRMVNLPALLNTYLDGYSAFRREAGLTPPEQEVVFLVISRENGCDYCVAAHSVLADQFSKLDRGATDAIRAGRPIADARLGALARFTEAMVRTRGRPTPEDVARFLEAGYGERHILGIVLALSVKILSNYSNHLFHTPVDEIFQSRAWTSCRAAA